MKLSEINVSYSNVNPERIKISSSEMAYKILLESWDHNTIELQETVKVMLLNRANIVLGIYEVSKGGISGTIVDIRLILGVALKCSALGIILAHNHPSGNLLPSEADKTITKRLREASTLMDISLLDHLIVSKMEYYSFADSGTL